MTPLDDASALEALRSRDRRLLAVVAHPDDEAYGCAGALARAGADPDATAVLVTLTSGEASTTYAARGLDPAGVCAMREERMAQVAARLGLDGLLLPRYPDGRLSREPLDRTAATVRDAFDALRPQVVILPDARGVNGHPDHIAAHWIVRRALEGRQARLAMLAYLQDTADAAHPRLIFTTAPEEVDVELRLSAAETQAKEDCLVIHEALVTITDPDATDRLFRPAVERYDLLGEELTPPAGDLFAGIDP